MHRPFRRISGLTAAALIVGAPASAVADIDVPDQASVGVPDEISLPASGLTVLRDGQRPIFDWARLSAGNVTIFGGSDVVGETDYNFSVSLTAGSGTSVVADTWRARPGGSLDVEVFGFDPGTEVEVWVFPAATRLETRQVDAEGRARLSPVLPSDLPTCGHTLYLRGSESDLTIEVAMGFLAVPVPDRFDDVRGNGVHGPAIGCLADRGVVRGISARRFAPEGTVTRGQAASLLARDAGLVDPSASHASAMRALSEVGVVAGYADGGLGLADPLTRGQAASLLARLHDIEPARSSYTDAQGVHGGAIGALQRLGVVQGYGDRTFGTDEDVRRDQFVTMLLRMEQRS